MVQCRLTLASTMTYRTGSVMVFDCISNDTCTHAQTRNPCPQIVQMDRDPVRTDTDRQAVRHADMQTDRQKDRHTDRQT